MNIQERGSDYQFGNQPDAHPTSGRGSTTKSDRYRDDVLPRLRRFTLFVIVLAVVASACQKDAIDVSVLNRCSERVEVRGSDIALDRAPTPWELVEVGERSRVLSASGQAETLFLAIRSDMNPESRVFQLQFEELSTVGSEPGSRKLVTIGGPDCVPISP